MKSKKNNKSTSFRHDHYSQNREKIKKRGARKKKKIADFPVRHRPKNAEPHLKV